MHHPATLKMGNIGMYTIGQVAKKFSLSRSTLLYYDSLGLLQPSGRSESNYRLYSKDDLKKMEKIALFREAGISLEAIASLLEQEEEHFQTILEKRLAMINNEIQTLRNQQQVILNLLQNQTAIKQTRVMTKANWVSLLAASGLDEKGMKKWHIEFERLSPEAHQDFLESIGIEPNEIEQIRKWSQKNSNP